MGRCSSSARAERAEDGRQEPPGDVLPGVELPRLLADQQGRPRQPLASEQPTPRGLDGGEHRRGAVAVAGPADRVGRDAAVRRASRRAGEALVVREAVGAVGVAARHQVRLAGARAVAGDGAQVRRPERRRDAGAEVRLVEPPLLHRQVEQRLSRTGIARGECRKCPYRPALTVHVMIAVPGRASLSRCLQLAVVLRQAARRARPGTRGRRCRRGRRLRAGRGRRRRGSRRLAGAAVAQRRVIVAVEREAVEVEVGGQLGADVDQVIAPRPVVAAGRGCRGRSPSGSVAACRRAGRCASRGAS